jgi:hypothetical protein
MNAHAETALRAVNALCDLAGKAKAAVLPGDRAPSALSVTAVSQSSRAQEAQEDLKSSVQKLVRVFGVAETCAFLLSAGKLLLQSGLAEIASVVAYRRCLQLLMTQGVTTSATTATLPESTPVTFLPLYAKCMIGLSTCCLSMSSCLGDEQLSLRRALLAAKLAQQGAAAITSRGTEASETYSILIYDAVELLLRACDVIHHCSLPLSGGGGTGPLSPTDNAQQTSAYSLWALHAVQSSIDLCAPRYLKWRSRVWAHAWANQLRAGNVRGAGQVAQHALAACTQLQAELEMDPPVPASTVRLLDHIRFRMQTLGTAAHAVVAPQAALAGAIAHAPSTAAALRTALASMLMVASAAPGQFLAAFTPLQPQVGGILALALSVRQGLLLLTEEESQQPTTRLSSVKSSRSHKSLGDDQEPSTDAALVAAVCTSSPLRAARICPRLPLASFCALRCFFRNNTSPYICGADGVGTG